MDLHLFVEANYIAINKHYSLKPIFKVAGGILRSPCAVTPPPLPRLFCKSTQEAVQGHSAAIVALPLDEDVNISD